jgi:hypothetical protein
MMTLGVIALMKMASMIMVPTRGNAIPDDVDDDHMDGGIDDGRPGGWRG